MELRASLVIALLTTMAACEHATPVEPAASTTASITSVRYERVRPVVGADTDPVVVTVWYALAPGDPYNRTSARLCVLDRFGATTFTCSAPRFEAIATGREWSAQVSDAAVSSLPVARDLYLNGTRIRVETYTGGSESGVFQIDAEGRVW